MNPRKISSDTLAKINTVTPMSVEHGKAVAQAWIEATIEATPETLKPGQVVKLAHMQNCTRVVILSVAKNGVWIRRTATDGEWYRKGIDQVKERVRRIDIMV